MTRPVITSFQNSKIKLANKLVNKRERQKNNLFLIDYARDLERALAYQYRVEFAFYCDTLATDDDKMLLEKLGDAEIHDVSADLMEKASYRQNPGGLVTIMQQKPMLTAKDAEKIQSRHILGLVKLSKPGNIGALLRTADATGFDTILLIDTPLDVYNPNIIRASTGAVFLDNIYQLTSLEALNLFAEKQISIVATHLDGTINLYDFDFTQHPTAIMLGAEDTGLEEIWVNHCDALVKIPMIGHLSDSLNVSVSGAIFMYEALRQHHTS
jgi:RNA methyltransferase, TrmH family